MSSPFELGQSGTLNNRNSVCQIGTLDNCIPVCQNGTDTKEDRGVDTPMFFVRLLTCLGGDYPAAATIVLAPAEN